MPEIAEAQALLAALAETDELKAEATQRRRLTQLHVAYGNALIAARGPGAPETAEAFARAHESAAGDKDSTERLAVDYGLYAGAFLRGELPSMRAHAAAFLTDVEARPDSAEAGVAHRAQGITHWFAGEFLEARQHLERALALFQPGRDDDLSFRFGQDAGVTAMAYLALVSWPLGEIDRAISLVEHMRARVDDLKHANTLAFGAMHAAMFALMIGNRPRAQTNMSELARIVGEHDLAVFRAFGMFFDGWARVESDLLDGMRRGVDSLRAQSILIFDGLVKIALAKTEAEAGDPGRAVAILDEALETADRLGHRTFEAELHRARGQVLLNRDPTDAALAEDAFVTAIVVAKQQGARSFELRAALALSQLYESTARPVEAHDILAPALEGFSPTLEMPEIAQAQALLAELSQTADVKAEAARRQRLTQLRIAQGVALFAARGGGAPETTEAFARARESASGDRNAPGRLAADYGLWVGSYVRGELPSMRARAAAFLSDVEGRPDSPEAGVAHRAAGLTCLFAGEYRQARDLLERALDLFQPGRDDELAFRFGVDPGVATMVNLAAASWSLGKVDRAISLIDRMQTRIADFTHVGMLAFARMHSAMFDLMRDDHARAAPKAFELARLAREHELTMYGAFGAFLEGWAAAAGGAPDGGGLEDMRRGAEMLHEQNILLFDGLVKIALADAEARAGDPDRAIAILDKALATADRTGYRAFEAELHGARGQLLLKLDPANSAPAEDALLTAIAVAKRQTTRSFELRAALALAKLYQSTARPVEAQTVLASALDGFAPTPEMPEIAEAQALLAVLDNEGVNLAAGLSAGS
jgi:tetratricopeptide (TPR) repeat protein